MDLNVIVEHFLMRFVLDVLLARFLARKCRDRSWLGKMFQARSLAHGVRNGPSSSWFEEDAVAGRLAVDTLAVSKEFNMSATVYSVMALSRKIWSRAVPERKRAAFELLNPTGVTRVPEIDQHTTHSERLSTRVHLKLVQLLSVL